MTCRRCLHAPVCFDSEGCTKYYGPEIAANNVEELCIHFVDRSRYVVRKKGEWIDIYGGKYDNPRYSCSHCGEKALYKFEVDVLGHEKTVQALTDSCPTCGADMRKG